MKGVQCPTCGAFARMESGGVICQRGHCFLYRRVLPRNHQLSGRDARNRVRQRHTDSVLVRPGRAREFMWERLESLEWLDGHRT